MSIILAIRALYVEMNERLDGSTRTDSDPPFDFHGRVTFEIGGVAEALCGHAAIVNLGADGK